MRVPFAHEIPAAKRDKQVKATLTSSPQSRAAILAWAVRGLREWLIAGELPVPEAVEASTKEYRDENDPLRDFLADCCVLDPRGWTPTQSLRRAYDDWCRDEGIGYPLTPKGFSERLKARGCLPRKQQHKRGWQGIKLAGTDGTDRP